MIDYEYAEEYAIEARQMEQTIADLLAALKEIATSQPEVMVRDDCAYCNSRSIARAAIAAHQGEGT